MIQWIGFVHVEICLLEVIVLVRFQLVLGS